MPCPCAFDELGVPVAADEERISPFQKRGMGAVNERIDGFCRREESFAEPNHAVECTVAIANGFADAEMVIENVLDGVGVEAQNGRLGVHAADGFLDRSEIDGADVAEILSDDHIGRKCGELFNINGVERCRTGAELLANLSIDLGRIGGGNALGGEDGAIADFAGEITLVRAADEAIGGADGAENFGCGREQADDAGRGHGGRVRARGRMRLTGEGPFVYVVLGDVVFRGEVLSPVSTSMYF